MEWFYFAAIAAISWGLLAATSKKLLEDTDVYTFTALIHGLGLVIYTPYFLYSLESSNLVFEGVVIALLSGMINVLGIYFYNASIKIGDLSEEIPLTRLSPVFTGILGVLILGETMSLDKASGIVLVTLGSIVILKEPGYSVKDSFEKIFTKKAASMAVASSVIYAFASIIDRVGTQILSPEMYTFFIYLAIASAFTAMSLKNGNIEFKNKLDSDKALYLLSACLAVAGSLAVFKAFSMAEASLVVPVLQIQVFLAIGFGGLYFKEKEMLMKTFGAIILIAGLLFLV